MKNSIALAALLVSLPFVNALAGCSSSSSGTGDTGDDAGSQPDTASTHHDSGNGGTFDSGGDTGSSGDDGGDLACPPAPPQPFSPQTYVAATKGQNVCQSSDISAFVNACGANGTDTACQNWQMAYLGDSGTACGNCIFAPDNNGGVWTDPQNEFSPNYAACIQLTDPTNGPTCAPALDNASGCEANACDQCSSDTDYQGCTTAADGSGGICNSYATAVQSACSSDFASGGAFDTCSPSGQSNNSDDDLTYIITLICGNGNP